MDRTADIIKFAEKCNLTVANISSFADAAKKQWNHDPDLTHKAEFLLRQRVLQAIAKKEIAQPEKICSILAKLGSNKRLTRWFS